MSGAGVTLLLMTGGGQQGELGAIGVVMQGVAVKLSKALPIAELPLGAGPLQEVFVIRADCESITVTSSETTCTSDSDKEAITGSWFKAAGGFSSDALSLGFA